MSGTNFIFTGEIIESGTVIVQGALAVFVTEYEISLSKHTAGMHRGKTLIVAPFSPKMFWSPALENGYQINMQGSSLGGYSNGPLGHPGDGEFEIYTVLTASISGKYRKEGLDIEIEVNTSRGREVCYIAKETSEEKLQPLNVRAKFLVPKDKLKEFLGFNDSNGKYFMDQFDAIN
ncbi:hypothetical protein CWO84_05410 [Methylomonas sp. Kb3]|uniref:hypothetical protein n=1 Tax=Methylomonas sp. Kb3 TaxID=1611544 RepID=UPI000C34DC1A|nr:hypothetical protein [Methylomonas sp. Kb3]PKD41149.1 hypothetical protein CWO84_05410 [Methylomonas sp. Kb3]